MISPSEDRQPIANSQPSHRLTRHPLFGRDRPFILQYHTFASFDLAFRASKRNYSLLVTPTVLGVLCIATILERIGCRSKLAGSIPLYHYLCIQHRHTISRRSTILTGTFSFVITDFFAQQHTMAGRHPHTIALYSQVQVLD